MMNIPKITRALALASLCAVSLGASAHGNADQAAHGPVRKEQKEWGIAGDASKVQRTINIEMSDQMRFTPDLIHVKRGATVRLIVRNLGLQRHELVIGTPAELEAHAAMMLKFPNMEHDEPYMAHVAQGQQGKLIWTFNRVGEFQFACLIPGHYSAGMVGKIVVE